jgi:integrase
MATIRKRGNKYQAGVAKAGYPRVSKSFQTKSAAKAWAMKVELQMDAGVYVDERTLISNKLSDLIDNYIDELQPVSPITGSKLASLRRMSRELQGDTLQQLNPQYVLSYAKRRSQDVSESTLTKELGYLSSVIDYARTIWSINAPSNAVKDTLPTLAKLKLVGGSRKRTRRLNEGEYELLMQGVGRQANSTSGNYWLGPMVDLALTSGMRQREIHELQWVDVDFDRHTVAIQSRQTPGRKQGSDHVIPMLPAVREVLLREYEGMSRVTRNNRRLSTRPDHVFGKPARSSSISDRFARVCKRVGIEDLTFHDLRHEAISRLFEDEAKYTIPQVALISGHKTWQSLRRYTQLKAENF